MAATASIAAVRAYLMACPAEERGRIFKNLGQSSRREDHAIQDAAWVNALLAQTCAQGYGKRDATYPSPDQVFHGQLGAIAVPIMVGRHALGCLSLIWILSMASEDMIVQRYLALLRKTAESIGKTCEQHGFKRPPWLDPKYRNGFTQAGA